MLRCIGLEFRKNCYWPYVLLPVIGIVCLGFGNTVYDASGESITLFELAGQLRAGVIAPDISFSAPVIWQQGLGSWLVLFAPLLVSERQNGQMKFELIRAGSIRYCASKVVSGALFGGTVFLTGYVLFGLAVNIFFPTLSSFRAEEQSLCMELYLGNSMLSFVFRRLAGAFMFGVFSSVFGIGVAVFFEDKYMLICLPFLLNYIYQQIIQKTAQRLYADGADSAVWAEAFYPPSIADISADRYWAVPVLALLLVYLAVTAAFCISVKRGKIS